MRTMVGFRGPSPTVTDDIIHGRERGQLQRVQGHKVSLPLPLGLTLANLVRSCPPTTPHFNSQCRTRAIHPPRSLLHRR